MGSQVTGGIDRVTLDRAFFARPVVDVARELLGCVLVHQTDEGAVAVMLSEVEAYAGAADPASHAFRGQTARNAVMFGEAGHAYVYFTYGMHFCVNLVCGPVGEASAVLLRAGRVVAGVALAGQRRSGANGRPAAINQRELARGPARLCQALGIDRAMNGADVCDRGSALRILGPVSAGSGEAAVAAQIESGPRVGVSSATEVQWRFWIACEPTVSVYRPRMPRKRGAVRNSGTGKGGSPAGKMVAAAVPGDGIMQR